MILRGATADDDLAILGVAKQCGLTIDPALERGLPQARLFVATSADEVLGFALLWLLGDEAEVIDLGVLPFSQGQGLGKQLLILLLKCATENGARCVFLEVRAGNIRARTLYERVGFQECGRRVRYYSDGEDALLYRSCVKDAV